MYLLGERTFFGNEDKTDTATSRIAHKNKVTYFTSFTYL